MFRGLLTSFVLASALSVVASPSGPGVLHARQDVQNIVYVTSTDKHWYVMLSFSSSPIFHSFATNSMIMPRDAHTNIGDSEHPGGMKTYCTPAGRYSSQQGQLPANFWSNIEFKSGKGKNGGRYAQRM